MDTSTLKAHIKLNEFSKYYIFTGPEVKMMDIYIEQIAKNTGSIISRPSSMTAISSGALTSSFVKSRFIYVFRDYKEFTQDDSIKSLITQKNTFSDCIFIFIYSTIDKRSKFYKANQDTIIDFQPMRDDVLVKYIQKDIDLDVNRCKRLINICEKDYSRILLEIDKIHNYCVGDGRTASVAFDRLLKSGVIYQPPEDAVFSFVDSVLKCKQRVAYSQLQDSKDCGEATLVLLSNLYTGAKNVLMVQSYTGDKTLSEATGLKPFFIKQACERKNVYSSGDLVYLMKLIRSVEKDIKTGLIEDSIAVDFVLAQFWG